MARRSSGEMTVEQFEAWLDAEAEVDSIRAASGEQGGPSVTFAPEPPRLRAVPAPDVLASAAVSSPPEQSTALQALPLPAVSDFTPVATRHRTGWSAVRQRRFIETLSVSGSIHDASAAAGISSRSAYRLRNRSEPFAAAWDAAQVLATSRLAAIAFDRAINGRVEQVYQNGDLVGERRVPSDRMLMWLLSRLDPSRFGAATPSIAATPADPHRLASAALPQLLGALSDVPADEVHCARADYRDHQVGEWGEDIAPLD